METIGQAFATAVQAVVNELEAQGYAIAEASFSHDTTPHVVATRNDELLFVLVQGLEGPTLAQFSEEIYHARMLPLVEAVTWHPKGSAVAQRAAAFDAQAVLALVGLIATDEIDADGDATYLTKVFPLRTIDRSGAIGAWQLTSGPPTLDA